MSSLIRTRLERDLRQMAQCVYSIPCECVRSCIGETSRPLAMQLHEHRHNLKEGLLEKSKFVQHEARILEIESNSKHRK
jgi:hypothetical protein